MRRSLETFMYRRDVRQILSSQQARETRESEDLATEGLEKARKKESTP